MDKPKGITKALKSHHVDTVKGFRDIIRRALDQAVENGYDELNDRPEDVAINMCDTEWQLECFNEDYHLLVPYIQEWQVEQRIKRGGSENG